MKRGWIAALLLALTACGGGGDSDGDTSAQPEAASESATGSGSASPASSSDEDALEAAYRTYVKAFLTGDGATAYALLSQRCQDANALSEFASLSESAADLYGEVDYTIKSVTVDGDKGSIDADYAVDALNSGGGSLWVKEDGEWHTDKCG